jgi:DNA-directed RNA polymerase subunit RPC12/RpoP
MICPKCGSEDVNVQAVAEQKKRGCLGACMWILLAICTLGLIILIPLLTKKGSKTRTYAVCQRCGHKWKA